MDIDEYWSDIDQRLKKLLKDGFVKLPSVKIYDLDKLSNNISAEMGVSTFKELGRNHEIFLEHFQFSRYLTPRLYDIAKRIYNFKGEISDQYHIARKVNPGNTKEMFRAHFDSHLFTVVIPIKIPTPTNGETVGELIYYPNSRTMPKNEIMNIISKAMHKRYASEDGMKKFALLHTENIENFIKLEPIIFIGKTTLHTNLPVSKSCSSYRLTLLAHFFDNSPRYGIGNFLRLLRKR